MPEPKVIDIAKVCHEVNRAYCKALGDESQLPWDEAPAWQQDSAVNGVLFHLKNPNITPEQSHESWLKEKLDDGWTYGPSKNAALKEHPCMLPYDQLPLDQKAKDYIFTAVVNSLK